MTFLKKPIPISKMITIVKRLRGPSSPLHNYNRLIRKSDMNIFTDGPAMSV